MRKQKFKTKSGWRGGFISMEIIAGLIVVGIMIGYVFLQLYPNIRGSLDANTFKGEFSLIEQGLTQYYSNNYKYPSGSGWTWDSSDAYVGKEIKNKGWQYSCSGNVVTITTPTIDSAKTRQKLVEALQKNADNVAESGNKLTIQLYNKPCS